jgi:hypothetical protein
MFLGMTILACLCYATIFIQPDIPFNPLSPYRATLVASQVTPVVILPITPTVDQSYPATWTATPTNTPGPTKTATDTRTPTPTKTFTPTKTPTPTRTFTPLPPTVPPPPTATPTPLPYVVQSHSSENNCADIGIKGVVNGADGLPKSGVQIQYGEIGVSGSRFSTTTDNSGRYGALLLPGSNKPAARTSHDWYAFVVENGQRASEEFRFTTDPIYIENPSHCDSSSNTNNNGNANDNNANDNNDNSSARERQREGCLPDPCESGDSIQIKIINWQHRPTEG